MLHRGIIALAIVLGLVAGVALAEEKNSSSTALDAQASQPANADLASLASAMHALGGSVLAELSKLSAQLNDTNLALGAFAANQASVNANVSARLDRLSAQLNDTNVALGDTNVALGAFSASQASVNANRLCQAGQALSAAE